MASLINSVILKIASRCNLNCRYCYVYNHEDQTWRNKPKFMSRDVYVSMLETVKRYCEKRPGHRLSLIFHGGEPLLVGKRSFSMLCELANSRLGGILAGMSIQTNGTLIDEEWARLFAKFQVRVGVSIDGPEDTHDKERIDHKGGGSYAEVVRGLRYLQQMDLDPAVLCVIQPGADGLRTYKHFRKLGVGRMNFLLPDVSHDHKASWYGTKGETPIADYLIPIFDDWFAEDNENVQIRLFWGLLRMLMGGMGETDAFGNPAMRYVVIDTDGAIEPLDALKVCDSGITCSSLSVANSELDAIHVGNSLLHQMVNEGLPLPGTCRSCPENKICGGGYYPHRYSRKNGFDNPSVWCADILKIINHLRRHIPGESAYERVRNTNLRERNR